MTSPPASEPEGSKRVAVVVVTYNSEQVLPGLLQSLRPAMNDLDWDLTVADNDSSDATVALLKAAAPHAHVIDMGRNAGYAAGINAALASSGDHDAVLVLNPDVRLRPGSVVEMLEMLSRPGTGIVVPRLLDERGHVSMSLRREPTLLRALGDTVLGTRRAGRYAALGETIVDPQSYAEETDAAWATGAAMLISHECVASCGHWDESFFLYSEETEYCLRARDRGFVVRLAPRAEAVHLEGDSKVSPRLWALLVTNRVRLYRRRHSVAATICFWFIAVAREGSRALIGRPQSRFALASLVKLRNPRSPAWP